MILRPLLWMPLPHIKAVHIIQTHRPPPALCFHILAPIQRTHTRPRFMVLVFWAYLISSFRYRPGVWFHIGHHRRCRPILRTHTPAPPYEFTYWPPSNLNIGGLIQFRPRLMNLIQFLKLRGCLKNRVANFFVRSRGKIR